MLRIMRHLVSLSELSPILSYNVLKVPTYWGGGGGLPWRSRTTIRKSYLVVLSAMESKNAYMANKRLY